MSEYDWRDKWEPRTVGGHEVLFVADKAIAGDLVGLVRHKGGEAAAASWCADGKNIVNGWHLIPLRARLTYRDLAEMGAVLRSDDGKYCGAARLYDGRFGSPGRDIRKDQSRRWSYRLPSMPAGEWRGLEEVSAT